MLLISKITRYDYGHVTTRGITFALLLAVVIAGYLVVRQVAYAWERVAQIEISQKAVTELNDIVAHVPPTDLVSEEHQRSLRLARNSIDERRMQLQPISLISVVSAIVTAVSLFLVLLDYSVWASVLIVACLVPLSVSAAIYARIDARTWPKISEGRRRARYYEDQFYYPTTGTELAGYGARNQVSAQANRYQRTSMRQEMRLERTGMTLDVITGSISVALLFAAVIILIFENLPAALLSAALIGVSTGTLAIGEVGFTLGSLFTGGNAIRNYLQYMERYAQHSGAAPIEHGDSASHKELTLRPDDHTAVIRENADAPAALTSISLETVAARYAKSPDPVLHGISLTARKGNLTALVGSNGAGKTTLIKVLQGILPADEGKVLFGEQDVTSTSFDFRARYMSVLSQDYGRYEFTIKQNLLLGVDDAERYTDNDLWEALAGARADKFVRELPDALDSQLGEQWDGHGLSGGQWQRLAIARLILRDSPVWILDEPTSAIDARAERELFEELEYHARERIIVVVSHRASTLKNINNILVVKDGKIVQTGTFHELMSAPGEFSDLFANQLGE